ncbi:hypothetical protein ABH935_005723 [Catenulispora sp. GAS73]|uniref:helix-turn-helix domain-containing protein n=1 Tax=Catenulispora sp. GAS73 TaxID=3156269 RepID=UPI00351805B1
MVTSELVDVRRSGLSLGSLAVFSQAGGLPVVLDLPSAARLFGICRTKAYRLAKTGEFPCRVLRVGRQWKVPTADLLAVLGLPVASPPATDGRGVGRLRGEQFATW